jgi:hypothetical protein
MAGFWERSAGVNLHIPPLPPDYTESAFAHRSVSAVLALKPFTSPAAWFQSDFPFDNLAAPIQPAFKLTGATVNA